MIKFNIITIFPEIFNSYFNESIIKRAQEKKLIKIKVSDLRKYTNDKRQTTDDAPFGGGPGMVMKIEPVFKAIKDLKKNNLPADEAGKQKVILFSTRGKKFDSKMAKRFSRLDNLIMICGRYEGVDERVAKKIADEEVSVGDYVLTGGEIPAMIVTDAVSRFIPGVLGKEGSLEEKKGSYPTYTRPEEFLPTGRQGNKWRVPKVLLSGNHKEIKKWRDGYKGLTMI